MFGSVAITDLEVAHPLQMHRDGEKASLSLADVFPIIAKITAVYSSFVAGDGVTRTAYAWRKQDIGYGGIATDSADGVEGLQGSNAAYWPAFADPSVGTLTVGSLVELRPTLYDSDQTDSNNHGLEWFARPFNPGTLTDYAVTGIINGFGDQYIGGSTTGGGLQHVRQLHYLSFSGAAGAKQGFDASEVIMDALQTNGYAYTGDWNGLHVRTGDRQTGLHQNTTVHAINIFGNGYSVTDMKYSRIEHRDYSTYSGFLFRSSDANNGANHTYLAALGTAAGGGGIANLTTGLTGFTGTLNAQLWVYGTIGCNFAYGTTGDIGAGLQALSGGSADVYGMKFRNGLYINGGSGTVPVGSGGTGRSTLTAGQLLMGDGTDPVVSVDSISGGTF